VHSTSKKLLYQLDHLVQVCNQPGTDRKHNENSSNYENRPGGNPAADYSEGASHVLAVIHQILNHHRALEQKWHAKKIKLHQRLALRLFQEDVKQVCITLHEKEAARLKISIHLTIDGIELHHNNTGIEKLFLHLKKFLLM
ncbi:hypothetical protein Trydic_g23410, partial [Trypoxylus dichotomus]